VRTQKYYSQTRLHTATNVGNLLENRVRACQSKIEIVLILSHYARDSVSDSVRYLNNLQTNYVGRTAKQFSVLAVSKVCVARADSTGSSNSLPQLRSKPRSFDRAWFPLISDTAS
jgi:hypothetical protein